MTRLVAFALLLLARVLARADVRGRSARSGGAPRIYFANHASHLDFLVLWASLRRGERRRTRPVAALDYWGRTRVRRYVARALGAVLVDRTGHGGGEAVTRMTAALRAGSSLVLFPEGRRAGGAESEPFKAGLYHVARSVPDAELVPVFIGDTADVLPRGAVVPVPGRARVVFGAPFALRDGESKDEFLERARLAVEALRAQTKEARSRGPRSVPAATYSPGRFPSEYHRRWRA